MIAVVLLLSLLQAAPDAQPSAPIPSVTLPPELARVLTDYEKAWGARDPRALATLFAPDGFVLPNGGAPVRGRDAIAEHYIGSGGPLALRAVAFGMDGSTAYIIGGYSAEPGQPDRGKFTLTLRKAGDGRWLIVSDMDSPNSRPGASAASPGNPVLQMENTLQASTQDWNKGDLDAFVAPYHEAASFMTRTGPIGKAEMRARYEKNFFTAGKPDQQLRFEQLETVMLTGDAALMTGRFVLTGGSKPEQSGWFTLVWVRTLDGWKIVRDHTS